MNEIVSNHKKILMIAAFGAFAGMRPSECCNVRREDSALGPGIRFEMRDGEVVNIYIDLTEEKNLRSDLKYVGKIKKERTQKVYPAFLHAFMDCYNIFMKFNENRLYEAEYGALSNTNFGKAISYKDYLYEFHKAVQGAIPTMLASDDERTVHFAHLLLENHFGPHVFRHWFSVKLTLYGENAASLMYWRGDKSPESALTYLENKGELEKQFEKVNNEMFDYLSWRAEKVHG